MCPGLGPVGWAELEPIVGSSRHFHTRCVLPTPSQTPRLAGDYEAIEPREENTHRVGPPRCSYGG